MSPEKQPMQADGDGTDKDGGPKIASRRGGSGESGGGAYPNPHSGGSKKTKSNFGSFLGHGGQSDIGYTGPSHPNATAEED